MKTYLISLNLATRKLEETMGEYLREYQYEEKDRWEGKESYLLARILEKPCLNYTFQDLEWLYIDTKYSAEFIDEDLEPEDDYVYTVGGRKEKFIGQLGYGVYNLTEKDLYRIVTHIWERIVDWTIRTEVDNPEVDPYRVWHFNGKTVSADLIHAVNSIVEDTNKREAIISEVVTDNIQNEVYILKAADLDEKYNINVDDLLKEIDQVLLNYKVMSEK